MAKRHQWDRSNGNVWPKRCADCGVTGRVKPGTAGTMQYSATGLGGWVAKSPCGPREPAATDEEA